MDILRGVLGTLRGMLNTLKGVLDTLMAVVDALMMTVRPASNGITIHNAYMTCVLAFEVQTQRFVLEVFRVTDATLLCNARARRARLVACFPG